MSELTRKIVDFTYDGQAKEARESFYSALHDKVMAHLEAQKQTIAANLIAQESVEMQEEVELDESEMEHTGYTTKRTQSGGRKSFTIHKNGEKVGEVVPSGFRMIGHLHGKNLPSLETGEDSIHRFIGSKTGQSFISKALHHAATGTGRTKTLNVEPSKKDIRKSEKATAHHKLMTGQTKESFEMQEEVEGVEGVEESWDDMLKYVKDKNKPQPSGGAGKKQGTRYGGSKQKEDKKEEE